jgi:hypothetical protein
MHYHQWISVSVLICRLLLKHGLPPTPITSANEKSDQISTLGLRDSECIIAAEQEPDATAAAEETATHTEQASSANTTTSAAPAAYQRPKKRQRIRMPSGPGHRLGAIGDGDDDGGDDDGDGGNERDFVDGGGKDPYGQMAIHLASAVSGVHSSDSTLNSVLKSLRGSFREARQKLGAEQEALTKVAAALAGQVEFKDIPDGSMRMIVSIGFDVLRQMCNSRGLDINRQSWWNIYIYLYCLSQLVQVTYRKSKRTSEEECVQNLPPILLAAVLHHISIDPSQVEIFFFLNFLRLS